MKSVRGFIAICVSFLFLVSLIFVPSISFAQNKDNKDDGKGYVIEGEQSAGAAGADAATGGAGAAGATAGAGAATGMSAGTIAAIAVGAALVVGGIAAAAGGGGGGGGGVIPTTVHH